MPLPKKLLFYGLLTVLTLAAVEGMSRLAYFLAFDQWSGGGRPAVNPTLPPPNTDQVSPRGIQHPFYGYTHPAQRNPLNRMPPRPASADTVVIAVTGGSVAEEVIPSLRQALERHFAADNLPRRPVLLPLASIGMKQPQQAIVAANTLSYGGGFAVLVNLDGFNEIVPNRFNLSNGLFRFFPYHWQQDLDSTVTKTLLVGQIAVLRQEQAELTRAAASPLRHSAVFALLYRYRRQRTENRIIQLNHALAAAETAYSLEKHGPRHPVLFRQWSAELARAEVQSWYRGSLLLAELAQLAAAEYYHFQQPNQYVPDAKPLTAAELACCYDAGSRNETVYRETYPLLRQFGEKLQRQGVNYFDLNDILADNHETLYRDKCCHFNERGQELLAAAIVERLAPALRRAATNPPPVTAWSPAAPPRDEELLIDADFQVYRRAGHWLRYVKADCSPQDTTARFFLHITPAHPPDLPPARREHGFDNYDFQFADAGTTFNGQCIGEVSLPHYPIASIRTGQFRSDGVELWAGEYRFPQ